jgi:xylulokinase
MPTFLPYCDAHVVVEDSPMGSVTVGLDIGTTSVKAVAVDDGGAVVASARIPHRLMVPAADRLEHDADRAWRLGPRRALRALGDVDTKAIGVASMVPSMTAVDTRGRPLTAGLLYGDARGRKPGPESGPAGVGPEGNGEVVEFVRWTVGAAPGAAGFWPAPAVANRALGGAPAIDLGVAFTSIPLYGREGWDAAICADCGIRPDQLPLVEMTGGAAGRVDDDGPVLAAGSVDVWCEQLVAGAGQAGDVHVICGTTLIVWAVAPGAPVVPGLWTVGHRQAGRSLVGGASNAGGLFVDWATRLLGRPRRGVGDRIDPGNVPVWLPYPRGERTPYHDPDRRAALHGLDLTHGPAAARRAAWEASGFVIRHHLDLAAVRPARLVATGGGTRSHGWMQALADATGAPVHVAAAPEGAARGAAFLARVAAGLETDINEAERWARTGQVVAPDPAWVAPVSERYARFLELSGDPWRADRRERDGTAGAELRPAAGSDGAAPSRTVGQSGVSTPDFTIS